jgi:hypothetical protein
LSGNTGKRKDPGLEFFKRGKSQSFIETGGKSSPPFEKGGGEGFLEEPFQFTKLLHWNFRARTGSRQISGRTRATVRYCKGKARKRIVAFP